METVSTAVLTSTRRIVAHRPTTVVAVKLIARGSDIELRRRPPPDEIDYNRW